MSDTKHTEEPWELGVVGDKCKHLCPAKDNTSILTVALEYQGDDDDPTYFGAVYKPEDARRIVACVNACTGMDDPEKEIAALRAAAEKAREALKAVKEEKMPGYHDCLDDGLGECAWCKCTKALAELEEVLR